MEKIKFEFLFNFLISFFCFDVNVTNIKIEEVTFHIIKKDLPKDEREGGRGEQFKIPL